jgi:glutamine synthetase
MCYIGGLLKHIREFAAVTNPVVNSYKRIVPGYEAPVYITWSAKNRSSLIRIPATRGNGTRVELRCPDPACNPYLAFALMLRAGLDGIKNKIDPGEPTNVNIFHLTEKEREERGIRSLPADLKEAIDEMKGSAFVKEVLGDHVFNHYIYGKIWNGTNTKQLFIPGNSLPTFICCKIRKFLETYIPARFATAYFKNKFISDDTPSEGVF